MWEFLTFEVSLLRYLIFKMEKNISFCCKLQFGYTIQGSCAPIFSGLVNTLLKCFNIFTEHTFTRKSSSVFLSTLCLCVWCLWLDVWYLVSFQIFAVLTNVVHKQRCFVLVVMVWTFFIKYAHFVKLVLMLLCNLNYSFRVLLPWLLHGCT